MTVAKDVPESGKDPATTYGVVSCGSTDAGPGSVTDAIEKTPTGQAPAIGSI